MCGEATRQRSMSAWPFQVNLHIRLFHHMMFRYRILSASLHDGTTTDLVGEESVQLLHRCVDDF